MYYINWFAISEFLLDKENKTLYEKKKKTKTSVFTQTIALPNYKQIRQKLYQRYA